ncbi:MAG: 16S rRNA (guanine(966)-N(2))-methyltransferase RsmD [Candidatus Scalinduaceae bacterium]
MRVISGEAKGVRLSALSSKRTRPILNRIKESLFNILGDSVVDSNVLDLFAGTGSLGIEALSRGAKMCLFVDNDFSSVQVIKKNLRDTKFSKRSVILRKDVFALFTFLTNKHMNFDIILVAPPYKLMDLDCKDRERMFSLLEKYAHRKIVNKKGIIVLQHHKKQMVSQEIFKQLKVTDQRCYGNTQLTFLRINLVQNNKEKESFESR